ncbi:MAG: gamma-glutamyl-gamma-aminobutyrate hydrolase family protein [Acetobacteraceae bacterium]|nr:gamma-glutamyl-gamma-aminobutyrate hydrolase family protein [Acetobacteraceae bacterium]MSP30266.1 gamma-glutamyl-gamma-aminobutyrate hydrolase family protein [Acetobacteraceae bacterium]
MPLIVGIPACNVDARGHLQHATPARYGAALLNSAGAIPILIPPMGAAQLSVLDRLDGILLPGSPSNVHPSAYGGGDSKTPDWHDLERDATTLPLIRAALERGLPLLAICRGIQELNVALGGTLHQQVHALPGRMDHRGGEGSQEHRYRHKHSVVLSGQLAHIVGAGQIMVNSLHGQAIDQLAPGLVVEAIAADSTIEAVRVANAPGFAHGVQWHPEWRITEEPPSRALFAAFGAACQRSK